MKKKILKLNITNKAKNIIKINEIVCDALRFKRYLYCFQRNILPMFLL